MPNTQSANNIRQGCTRHTRSGVENIRSMAGASLSIFVITDMDCFLDNLGETR